MDSFYGSGHQHVDFVLRGAFSSVESMIEAFKQGPSYTDIWYGEYCIIDTPNKNDKDNGKIYRRGLEYQNAMGGAIYVGQIVGSSSGTPLFEMHTLQDAIEKSTIPIEEDDYRKFPVAYNEDKTGFIYNTERPNDPIGIFPFSTTNDTSLVPGKYIEDSTTKYNDEIRWTWVNIRKPNQSSDSIFYVGFEIPYTVIDYAIHMTSPYDINGDILTDATEIERTDTEEHPFYEKWDLGIPKGVKGDTLRNLRVIVPTENDKSKIYDASAITVNHTTGEAIVGTPGYVGLDDDIAAGRQIIVFDYYIFDKLRDPEPIMIYLGDFNIITAINIDDEGTLTVEYAHDDDTVFTKKIRWVNGVSLTEGNGTAGGHITFTFNNDNPTKTQEFDISWIKGIEIEEDGSLIYSYAGTPEEENMPENAVPVKADGISADTSRTAGFYRVEDFLQWIHNVSLNSENGHFYVTNNRDETIFETDLDWIKDIQFAEDGSVTLVHTSEDNFTYTNLIKWIDSVTLDQTTGRFTIDWNYGEDSVTQLDWTDDIYINEEDGNIYVHHTNQDLNTEQPTGTAPFGNAELLDAHLKLIVKASVAENGVVTFVCNTGETIRLNQEGKDAAFQIKVIQDITLKTGIYEDKHIFVKYNTEDSATPIGDPINYIQDMVVRPEDFHLLVLYNDPAHRYPNVGGTLDEDGKDENGHAWVNNVAGSQGETAYRQPDIYWRDMGSIKDQAGILIGLNLDSSEVEDAGFDPKIAGSAGDEDTPGTGVCGYLQSRFANGLTGTVNSVDRPGTAQKIVVYSPPKEGENLDKQDTEFYAYDYNTYKWFYLGRIADSGMRDAKLIKNTDNLGDALAEVTAKGLLFKYYSTTKSDTAIPKYWAPSSTILN